MTASATRAARDVRAVFGRMRRQLRAFGDVSDLTPSQTSVFSRLAQDGPATASDLATAERVRPQSVAATLAVLEARGLTERHPDPSDGRRRLISLSPAGRELWDDSGQAREEWLARTLQERLTEAERATLIEAMALLDRLTRS